MLNKSREAEIHTINYVALSELIELNIDTIDLL